MSPVSFDLASLFEAFKAGFTGQELVDQVFARIARVDDPGIFITLRDRDAILTDYARLGAFDPVAKPLWGLPFAVKDNIDVAGLPTTAGCPAFAYEPVVSAPAVARLEAAGAVVIGKTNLDQFAAGLVGVRTPYPVPYNAFDRALIPGGSSSGSAVAVAHGIVSFALGTDTAGSGRIPAGLNNIVGLKPSVGLISTKGVVPACKTLDCVSVFAMTVEDAYAVLAACAGYDASEPYSRHVPLSQPALPPKLRLGVPNAASRRFFGDACAEAAFDTALQNAAFANAAVVPVDFTPFFEAARLLYEDAWVAERYEAVRGFVEAQPDALFETTRGVLLGARNFSAADVYGMQYRLAAFRRASEPVWDAIDVLIVPTLPLLVTRARALAEPITPSRQLGTYTNFVNMLDLAALSVPIGTRTDGGPAGLTLIARAGQDPMLATLGAKVHAQAGGRLGATDAAVPAPRERAPAKPEGLIEILVVGAHLSGMPLNRELTDLGGSFVRQVETAPLYKLFALSGGPPRRPGLLRVAAPDGSAITAEIWALPAAGFGRFVAAIPAPLCIGTLLLSDGTSAKGFLCEADGLRGADDISHYGGWRSFIAAERKHG